MTVVIDVRTPEEYKESHVENAISIPLGKIEKQNPLLEGIPKGEKVIVYCNSGRRSGMAKQILESLGHNNVVNGINQHKASELK